MSCEKADFPNTSDHALEITTQYNTARRSSSSWEKPLGVGILVVLLRRLNELGNGHICGIVPVAF